jgi:hypothetical protein
VALPEEVLHPAAAGTKVAVAAEAAAIAYWCWWWVGGSDMATDAGSGLKGNFLYAPIDSPPSGQDVTLFKLV